MPRRPTDYTPQARSSAFAASVLRERALLALGDPVGERDAVEPLSEARANQILTDPDVGLLRSVALPKSPSPRRRQREDGRALLDRLGADPTRDHGMLRCPLHEDRHASLSWRLTADGKPLIHCFSGCAFDEIVAVVS